MRGFKSFLSAIAVLLLLAVNVASKDGNQIKILNSGIEKWNKWREKNTRVEPNLWGANLAGADLWGANLWKANLVGADLQAADLDSANLRDAHLDGANLMGAHLWGANLVGANLWRANLAGANLQAADLDSANLRDAHLDSANLMGAFLWGVNLDSADLSKVRSFHKAKLDQDILSEIKTKWPEKLATIWDDIKRGWVIDNIQLEQIKKPDWNGWPEEKGQGK